MGDHVGQDDKNLFRWKRRTEPLVHHSGARRPAKEIVGECSGVGEGGARITAKVDARLGRTANASTKEKLQGSLENLITYRVISILYSSFASFPFTVIASSS